jgi:5-methylcytosine-specific restriction endonuclease McrA
MDVEQQRLVWLRAGGICEYCGMSPEFDPLPFCIDHIIAQKHHGATTEDNLALACYNCNSFKGPNIAGIDPETAHLVPLFNPRAGNWEDHFEWNGAVLVGRTAVGRATVDVLSINHQDRIEHRRLLIAEGILPGRRTE